MSVADRNIERIMEDMQEFVWNDDREIDVFYDSLTTGELLTLMHESYAAKDYPIMIKLGKIFLKKMRKEIEDAIEEG
jgi:hypothetical protein